MKNNKKILDYFIDYLIRSIDELNLMSRSDFNDGEFFAYIECLEILSSWNGFKKYGITDIEKHFKV